jgi:predicted component of type VI protein secretion system
MSTFMMILAGMLVFLTGCKSNPNKAEKIQTEMDKTAAVGGDEKIGVNKDGNLIVQKKVMMNEELRRLQYEVFELEDRVYGHRKYGSKGLYGALKGCREESVSKKLGGDGKLVWTEPIDRVTDKEDDFNIGIDEKEKIVGVSEEFLKDRIARFKKYKQVLVKRQDEYEEKLEICDAALKAKKEGQASAQ